MTVLWYFEQAKSWNGKQDGEFRFFFSAVCAYVLRSLVILVLASYSSSSFYSSWSLWLRESDNSTILKFQSDFSCSLFSLLVRIKCLPFSVYLGRIFAWALCVSYACSLPPLATIFLHRYAPLLNTHDTYTYASRYAVQIKWETPKGITNRYNAYMQSIGVTCRTVECRSRRRNEKYVLNRSISRKRRQNKLNEPYHYLWLLSRFF